MGYDYWNFSHFQFVEGSGTRQAAIKNGSLLFAGMAASYIEKQSPARPAPTGMAASYIEKQSPARPAPTGMAASYNNRRQGRLPQAWPPPT
jgi:hypothetical protein